jgi:hypothetical protein
VPQR